MNSLEQEIRALIQSEGPISVSRYMSLALGHPKHGYYMTRDPFGAGGDFVTAPEISQMFGEMIGIWCAEIWRTMGEPERVHIVELGPGRGTLMSDLLRAARIVPAFRNAIEVHLIETSPVLIELQKAILKDSSSAVYWHGSVQSMPDGPLIVVANEFVDALPVDQIIKTEPGWHERKIGLRDGKLAFALDPTPLPQIEESLPDRLRGAPVGSMLESRDLTLFHELAKSIGTHGGAALLIDYGHTRTDFGDTLQAVRAHLPVDPLDNPGEADLTAHVNFEQLAIAGMMSGVHALGPVNQGDFLRALGIELRAERLRRDQSQDVAMAIDTALARLIDPSPGMGELFKVLAYAHPSLPTPPGFDT